MLGVSWGAFVHPTCSCIGDCTCQARIRQTNLQESLDSLGIEWGLRVRPKPYSPKKRVRESLSPEEAIHIDSSSTEAESEEEERDPLRAFDDICITDAVADRLCFRERLEVAETPAGSALGHVVVSVCRSRTHGHLHVRVAGNADLPTGALCSTSVVGCVNYRNQRTADERRYERCEEKDKGEQEKFLYMAQDEGNKAGHYFSITARQRVGEYEDRRSQEVPFADVANLISEALTVILLRYVGLTGYVGTLHLQAVLPNGALVPCEFEAEDAKKRMVYGHEVRCAAVTQYSADARGCPVVLRSLISTTTGQILRHAPVGGPEEGGNIGFVLRAPHRHPPATDREELAMPEPLAHDWDDDLQAQGMHRDKKSEEETSMRRPGAYETEGEGETSASNLPGTRGGDVSTDVRRHPDNQKRPYETGDEQDTSQSVDQQYQPQKQYTDQRYPEEEYSDQNYPQEYPDQQYTEGEYPDQQYPEGEYPDQQYPEGEYRDQQYPDEYRDQQYPEGEYPDQQHPQDEYRDQKYPQQDQYRDQYPQQDQYADQQYPQHDQYTPQDQRTDDEYPPPPASEQGEIPRPEFLEKNWASPMSGREPLRFPQREFPEYSPHDTRPPGEYGPQPTQEDLVLQDGIR